MKKAPKCSEATVDRAVDQIVALYAESVALRALCTKARVFVGVRAMAPKTRSVRFNAVIAQALDDLGDAAILWARAEGAVRELRKKFPRVRPSESLVEAGLAGGTSRAAGLPGPARRGGVR